MWSNQKTLDDLEQDLVKQAVETIGAKIGAKKTPLFKSSEMSAIVRIECYSRGTKVPL
jgi:hypothetical protein